MAVIDISELNPAGSQLFQDSESFLNELTDDEIVGVEGGLNLTNYLKQLSFNLADLTKLKSAQTILGIQGNSVRNNTINGQTYNARTANNVNTR